MENALVLIIFISIILMILGFVFPKYSLFWYSGERTRLKSFGIYLTVLLISIIILSNTGKKESYKKKVKVKDSTYLANQRHKEKLNNENASKWQYSNYTDKMTNSKVYLSYIVANDLLDFEFPYSGGSIAKFTIRKKDNSYDTYLTVSKGQFNANIDETNIRIKFDNENPKYYSISAPSDNSSDFIFINNSNSLVKKLKKSKTMIIEVEFYREGIRQIEFDVRNLNLLL